MAPQDDCGGAAAPTLSTELNPDDWDGRRIRRPLNRASVEARRQSSFKGESPPAETENCVGGGFSSGRRLAVGLRRAGSGGAGSGRLPDQPDAEHGRLENGEPL